MELYCSIIKNMLIFSEKKYFHYIPDKRILQFPTKAPTKKQKNPPPKKFLIFQEMGLSYSNIKKIVVLLSQKKYFILFPKIEPCTSSPEPKIFFKKVCPEKNSLYFRKRGFLALILKFLYSLERKLFYISGNKKSPYILVNGTF